MSIRHWFLILLITALPVGASAGLHLEASGGYSLELRPQIAERQEPNIMLSIGWSFWDWLKPQVGVAAGFKTVKSVDTSLQLQVRPMLVISPPLLPIYGRFTLALKDIFQDSQQIAFGGAVGLGFTVTDLGIFFEVGALPVSVASEMIWFLEGRAGVSWTF